MPEDEQGDSYKGGSSKTKEPASSWLLPPVTAVHSLGLEAVEEASNPEFRQPEAEETETLAASSTLQAVQYTPDFMADGASPDIYSYGHDESRFAQAAVGELQPWAER